MMRWALGFALCSLLCGCAASSPLPLDRGLPDEARHRGAGSSGKHALIIAVGAYPRSGGYPALHAAADVPLVEAALTGHDFDVAVLADTDATAQNIRAALTALIANVKPGDTVVLHYSGHGHRIADQASPGQGSAADIANHGLAGDELDGYDELFVPVDAPAYPGADYTGERHLRDDEVGWWLQELRQALGADGHLLVTVDACFSGTVTRGLPARGLADPIGQAAGRPSTAPDTVSPHNDLLSEDAEGASSRGGLASIVVVSAAQSDELAFETRDDSGHAVGALSLALSRTLTTVNPDTTYAAWFTTLSAELAVLSPNQTPSIEGALDTTVLAGVERVRPPHHLLHVGADNTVFVQHGALLGLTRDTRLAVYTADQGPGTHTPLGKASVAGRNNADATLVLEGMDPADADGAWAYVTAWKPGAEIALHIDDTTLAPQDVDALEQALEGIDVLRFADMASAQLIVERRKDGVWLASLDGGNDLLGPFDATDVTAYRQLRATTLRWARGRMVRNLSLSHPDIDVRLRLVPAEVGLLPGECSALPAGSPPFLAPEAPYLLEMENVGRHDAYIQVLNVVPDGTVSQLIPFVGEAPEALAPDVGPWRPPNVCIFAGNKRGTEVIKLVASREPIDFSPVLAHRGEDAEVAQDPLSLLFDGSFTGQSRGQDYVPTTFEASTAELGIVIR